MEPTIQIAHKSDYTTISFSGNLQYGYIDTIKQQLQSQTFDSNLGFLLNMSHVQNIDSTGFGMIVNFAKKVAAHDKKIVILVVDDFVRKLFAMSQCDKIFPIVKTEEEALQALRSNTHTELSIEDY